MSSGHLGSSAMLAVVISRASQSTGEAEVYEAWMEALGVEPQIPPP
jgi:hypothetical protein